MAEKLIEGGPMNIVAGGYSHFRSRFIMFATPLAHLVFADFVCLQLARVVPIETVFAAIYAISIALVPFSALVQSVNWATPEKDETPREMWLRKWFWLNVMLACVAFYLVSDLVASFAR